MAGPPPFRRGRAGRGACWSCTGRRRSRSACCLHSHHVMRHCLPALATAMDPMRPNGTLTEVQPDANQGGPNGTEATRHPRSPTTNERKATGRLLPRVHKGYPRQGNIRGPDRRRGRGSSPSSSVRGPLRLARLGRRRCLACGVPINSPAERRLAEAPPLLRRRPRPPGWQRSNKESPVHQAFTT